MIPRALFFGTQFVVCQFLWGRSMGKFSGYSSSKFQSKWAWNWRLPHFRLVFLATLQLMSWGDFPPYWYREQNPLFWNTLISRTEAPLKARYVIIFGGYVGFIFTFFTHTLPTHLHPTLLRIASFRDRNAYSFSIRTTHPIKLHTLHSVTHIKGFSAQPFTWTPNHATGRNKYREMRKTLPGRGEGCVYQGFGVVSPIAAQVLLHFW